MHAQEDFNCIANARHRKCPHKIMHQLNTLTHGSRTMNKALRYKTTLGITSTYVHMKKKVHAPVMDNYLLD
uniref:Uncharacterized protein n=1 Tax=Rhizophora mucronata TaxID=61149 RepID=A0A2P2N678_RHIMU